MRNSFLIFLRADPIIIKGQAVSADCNRNCVNNGILIISCFSGTGLRKALARRPWRCCCWFRIIAPLSAGDCKEHFQGRCYRVGERRWMSRARTQSQNRSNSASSGLSLISFDLLRVFIEAKKIENFSRWHKNCSNFNKTGRRCVWLKSGLNAVGVPFTFTSPCCTKFCSPLFFHRKGSKASEFLTCYFEESHLEWLVFRWILLWPLI